MLAAYLLGEKSTGLKHLAFTRLGRQMTEITELIGSGRDQLTMDKVDARVAGEYACADVEVTFALAELLAPEIEQEGMSPLLREIEQPLVPVLIELEGNGIAIDSAYLKTYGEELAATMAALAEEIDEIAGRPLKVGSPKQLGAFLFEELGLPSGRKTKTGYSVDNAVLETLRDKHPIVELIVQHRQIAKLRSTYVDALPLQVDPTTGRVHTSFNQTIAATGRLSSIDPNLQNIPIRSELGRRVRRAFVADRRPEFALVPDAVLMSADYSQIELRLLADRSGEPFLVEAFNAGEDIHGATAAVVAGGRAEGRHPRHAARRQDGQLRRPLRDAGLRPLPRHRPAAGRGPGLHRPVLGPAAEGQGLLRRDPRRRAPARGTSRAPPAAAAPCRT
jgi:DNA polymerase-1